MATTTMASQTLQINHHDDIHSNNATINHMNKSKTKWWLLGSVCQLPLEPAIHPSQLWVHNVWQGTKYTQHNLPWQSPVWLIVTSAICHKWQQQWLSPLPKDSGNRWWQQQWQQILHWPFAMNLYERTKYKPSYNIVHWPMTVHTTQICHAKRSRCSRTHAS